MPQTVFCPAFSDFCPMTGFRRRTDTLAYTVSVNAGVLHPFPLLSVRSLALWAVAAAQPLKQFVIDRMPKHIYISIHLIQLIRKIILLQAPLSGSISFCVIRVWGYPNKQPLCIYKGDACCIYAALVVQYI